MSTRGSDPTLVDLTNDADLTHVLLHNTRAWRQRLVEHLMFGSSDTVQITSSYQIEITWGFLQDIGLVSGPVDAIRCILPVTTRPKASLLGFQVEGPDGAPARLLLRRDIAAIEASFLMLLWELESRMDRAPSVEFLEAITGFHAGRCRRALGQEAPTKEGIATHLGATLPFVCSPSWVGRWMDRSRDAAKTLCAALDEPPEPYSAAEQPLLALTDVEPRPSDLAGAEHLLNNYLDAVEHAAAKEDIAFLRALGEYGRRWEVLLETQVPLDQPTVLRLVEDRHLDLGRAGRTTVHLSLGDAWSYHLEARVADHAVEFAPAGYVAANGTPLTEPDIEDRRDRRDSLALYTSVWQRPVYARLNVRLRANQDQRLAAGMVSMLTLVALIAAVIGRFHGALVEAMALLTVPTTFAATLVLTRHESALAARLQRAVRRLLALLVCALWAVAIGRLIAAGALT